MYDATSEHYDAMMDAEIQSELYVNALGRLSAAIANVRGPVIDTSCGSGHMLRMLRDRFEASRVLVGVDLSPAMVAISRRRMGDDAEVREGDMTVLDGVESGSAAAVVSFFALHHLSSEEAAKAIQRWAEVLAPGGRLLLATWEGQGEIDYGDSADLVALRFSEEQVREWIGAAGLTVARATTEAVPELEMDAVYLDAAKP